MNNTQISVPDANFKHFSMVIYLIEKTIDEKTVFESLIEKADKELGFQNLNKIPDETKKEILQTQISLEEATSSFNEKNLSAQKSLSHRIANRKDNTYRIAKLTCNFGKQLFYALGCKFLLKNCPQAGRELSWETYLSNTQERRSSDAGPISTNRVTETNKQNKNDQSSEDGVTQSASSLDGVKIQKAQSSQTESDSTNNQSSSVEQLRKENDRLHEKIRQLVEENQVLQRENSKTGRKTQTKEKQNAIYNDENNAKKPVFICKSCGLKFSHRSSLSRHINTHKPNKGYNFKCRLCEKVFRSPSNRSSHEKLHAKEPKRAEENSNHVESTTVE